MYFIGNRQFSRIFPRLIFDLNFYPKCLFEKAPYAESEEDWKKLLPWNIEITPYKIRGEWI